MLRVLVPLGLDVLACFHFPALAVVLAAIDKVTTSLFLIKWINKNVRGLSISESGFCAECKSTGLKPVYYTC